MHAVTVTVNKASGANSALMFVDLYHGIKSTALGQKSSRLPLPTCSFLSQISMFMSFYVYFYGYYCMKVN